MFENGMANLTYKNNNGVQKGMQTLQPLNATVRLLVYDRFLLLKCRGLSLLSKESVTLFTERENPCK